MSNPICLDKNTESELSYFKQRIDDIYKQIFDFCNFLKQYQNTNYFFQKCKRALGLDEIKYFDNFITNIFYFNQKFSQYDQIYS